MLNSPTLKNSHYFLWHRWLTSRPPPGNCDLVKCICTIRATRCTRSSFFPSSGHLTHITPYPCLSVAPLHIKQSPGPPSLSLLVVNFNFKSLKSTSILTIFSIWVLLFRPQSHDSRWLGRYREKSTNYSPHRLLCWIHWLWKILTTLLYLIQERDYPHLKV